MNAQQEITPTQKLSRMLTRKDLQEVLRVSRKTLARLIAKGTIPAPLKVGCRDRWMPMQLMRHLLP